MPMSKINDWLKKERQLGSTNPNRVVLATASANGEVHSRIVAIKELNDKGIVFFTQKNTQKVNDLSVNPSASMTLWLPLQQREVVLEGIVVPLTQTENKEYWDALSRERQLRFMAYSVSTGKPIESHNNLDMVFNNLLTQFHNKTIPLSELYCGFNLIPNMIYFYTLEEDTFSEMVKYTRTSNNWEQQLICP